MTHLLDRRSIASCSSIAFLYLVLASIALTPGLTKVSHAQVTTSITPTTGTGNLGTTVTASGNTYGIRGGSTVGTSLFHSFGQFSVATGDTAQFQTNNLIPNAGMHNILSRVTGGNPSSIFGTIDSATFYPSANLFLMNPAGVIFGPTATLNVGGMATFTTSDYLKLADGGRFNANPSALPADLLTTAPVAAFGFLGANPGPITVQGSQFTMSEGTGISLVGGNITIQATGLQADGTPIQPTHLSAPGGQINIASVARPGEILASTYEPASPMSLGSISISQGSVLDVSGNAGGTVRIRGGTFVMDQAAISANSVDADGAPVAIDIHTTGNVSISTTDVPALTAMTTGTGNAGEVKITSGSTDITGTAINSFLFSVIDTHTSGSGRAGNVAIDTGDLNFTAIQFAGVPIFVDSGTIGPNGGHGGDISIRAHNFTANDTVINSGNSLALQLGEESTGSAGNISISADSLQFSNVIVVADAFSLFSDNIGQSGNILLNVPNIALDQSVVTTVGGERGGSLVINTDHLTANNTQLTAQTFQSPGGGITVNGSTIELTGGSSFVSSTGGDGSAGPINITATDHLLLSRVNPTDQVSGIFSNSFGSVSGLGNAGDITITTPILTMTGGSRINTSTATNGHGGNVIIHADTISMSGEAGEVPPPPLFALGVTQQSGIFTLSTGGNCAGACGDAGNISITTHSLSMGAGSQINSGTSGSGRGGNITIDAADSIAMAGTISTGEPGGIFSRAIGTDPGSGSGGNITLLAGNSVTISDGAQVSASTLGPGNAGNITIQGLASPAQSVLITGAGSGIFTDTQGSGAGGNIVVNANSVTLSDGGALSATTSGPNHGGDIQISATTIDLSGLSTISALSSAGDNTAGNAGNIALRATQQITAVNSFLNTDTVGGSGLGGNILLRAPTITVDGAVLSTSTSGAGNAGNILLEGQRINSQGAGADLFAVTSGSGHGGTVTLRGLDGPGSSAESVTISGASRVHSLTAADGTAGDISIHAGQFTLTDHATINADTFGAGAAGAITIAATQQALISGSSTAISSSSDSGATGHAGQITLSAPTVMIENGGRILTSTTGGAAGGDIGITAGQSFIMTNGASISANSTGTGNAGSVQITAGNQFAMTNSTITTEANQSSGGIIKITTNPSGTVDLSNSTISASVLDGSGGGGSVSLDPQFVILQNSQILAQAQQGPGGNINITITNGGTFLPDATSVVSASSQFGQQGTVTIQAPIAPAGGKIQPLGKAPLQVTALLSQRCAAIARGEISSFVVAGRDTLPTEPGGWLPSPLALGPPEAGAAVHAGDRTSSSESSEPTILSLRRLPSPSKVAQLLTDDWVTDCGS